MKKTIIAIAAALSMSVLVAPVASATSAVPSVVPAKASDYSTKSKNRFWNAVKRLDSDARIVGKKDIIEMGVVTCDLLRAGGDITDLAMLAYEADSLIQDLVVVTFAAAPVYLCPDQQYKFD